MRRFLLAALTAAILGMLSACSGPADIGSLQPPLDNSDTTQPGSGFAAQLPALPAGTKHSSLTSLVQSGDATWGNSELAQFVAGDAILPSGAPGGQILSYGIYEFAPPDSATYPVEVRAIVAPGSEAYWFAIADYASGRWHLDGPFTGAAVLPLPQTGDFLSPAENTYVAILTYDGASVTLSEVELKTSANPPPAAPEGLVATLLPGSVQLSWDASPSVGVVGYNVYFAKLPFGSLADNTVARANLNLVPATATPTFEFTQLEANRLYHFRVATVVADQVQSVLSDAASINTTFALATDIIAPARQYPGFWCYLTGLGFDPGPGQTRVVFEGVELPADHVNDVSPGQLRLRVPLNTPTDEPFEIRVRVGLIESDAISVFVVPPTSTPRAGSHLGQQLYTLYEPYTPRGVAVDPDGNVWIANQLSQRLEQFSAAGVPLHQRTWQFFPGDIEALPDGRILLKSYLFPDTVYYDPAEDRFDPAVPTAQLATFLRGQFCAWAPGNIVYLSDTDGGVVRKYVNGVHTIDIGAVDLDSPTDVEVAANGNLIVADNVKNSVFWFEADGDLIGSYSGFDDFTPDDGELRDPKGLALSPDGSEVYVADGIRRKVLTLKVSDRSFVREWGNPGYLNGAEPPADPVGATGRFLNLWGAAVLPTGEVLCSDELTQRTGVYDALDGELLRTFGSGVATPEQFVSPRSLAVRPSDGALAVLDRATGRISLFNRFNWLIRSRYLETAAPGDFGLGRMERFGYGLAWDGGPDTAGRMFLAHGYYRMTRYNSQLQSHLVMASVPGGADGQLNGALDVEFYNGEVFVLDKDNDRVQVYNAASGAFTRNIAFPETGLNAHRLAVDGERNYVYVQAKPFTVDTAILRFNLTTGAYLDRFESPDTEVWGSNLAVDPAGYIYVDALTQGSVFAKYDPPTPPGGAWTLLDRFMVFGDGDGEIRDVADIIVTPDGRFCIADPGRRQIVILVP